jgi:hypothetical protein
VSGRQPLTDTPARARLAEALLAWGSPRPRVPGSLAADLRQVLVRALHEMPPDRTVTVVAGRSGALSPGQDQELATPFVHDRANVRGVLAQAAVERDLLARHRGTSAAVVAGVWHEAASRAPGDPRSRSWWLNHLPRAQADDLRTELGELLEGFREVWPALPADDVVVRPSRSATVELLPGRAHLRGRVGPRIDSVRADDRARVLLLDLRTSRPRPDRDRRRLRELALLETLATGRPPFRWASLHLTDGRVEVEDLDPTILQATAEDVAAGCRRHQAGPAGAEVEGLSQAGGTITP